MIQRISKGRPVSRWGYALDSRKCHFCKKVIRDGEEWIGFNDDHAKSMHRYCLDKWLASHPPKPQGVKPKQIQSDEEAEAEFERLRKELLKAHKPTKTRPRRPAKPRSKTTS